MTTEKLYTLARAACIEYARASGVENDPETWAENAINRCPEIAACYELAAALRDDLTKKGGRGSVLSAAKRIIKKAQKYARSDTFKGAWTTEVGQCVCDGFRGVILYDPLPGLPPVPATVDRNFDLQGVIDGAKHDSTREITDLLPTVPQAKETLARMKAEHPEAYKRTRHYLPAQIADTGIYVNPEYLIDMLEILPGAHVYASTPLRPLYFEAPTGRGVLFPIHPKAINTTCPTFPMKGAPA